MFRNPFSFEGRIRRKEFGISVLIYFVIMVIMNITLLPQEDEFGYATGGVQNGEIFVLVALVPILWFISAQGAKRCHDMGKSGWWQLVPFFVFIMLFSDSHYGLNEYGENPKGEGNIEEQFEFLRQGDQSSN